VTKVDRFLQLIGDILMLIGFFLLQMKASHEVGYYLPIKALSSIDFFLASGILIYLCLVLSKGRFFSR
jgi:hypothetical protein